MDHVTLGEGRTPVVYSRRIGPSLGLKSLIFKLELCNPSGSYKDRFVAAQVSAMGARGVRSCLATSSGNTGSALAAYCARYEIRCTVIVNEHAPAGKLMQMQAHGASVVRVRGFATSPKVTQQVYAQLDRYSQVTGAPLVVSAYRYCSEGMKGVESLGVNSERYRAFAMCLCLSAAGDCTPQFAAASRQKKFVFTLLSPLAA